MVPTLELSTQTKERPKKKKKSTVDGFISTNNGSGEISLWLQSKRSCAATVKRLIFFLKTSRKKNNYHYLSADMTQGSKTKI